MFNFMPIELENKIWKYVYDDIMKDFVFHTLRFSFGNKYEYTCIMVLSKIKMQINDVVITYT